MDFKLEAQKYTDSERMAADYLVAYFGNQKIEYPINPFAFLKHEGVLFTLSNFHKLDPAGNIKPDKEKSTGKIDGAVATVMALDRAIRCGGTIHSSVYDDRGLLIF